MTLKWEENSLLVNYSKMFVRDNLWKIEYLGYDKEDFMQECFIVYYSCLRDFKGEDDAHFFAFFKRSLENFTITLSNKCTMERNYIESLREAPSTSIDPGKDVFFRFKLMNAPVKIKKYLRRMMNDPTKKANMFEETKKYLLEE